jgi:hypothetical protein
MIMRMGFGGGQKASAAHIAFIDSTGIKEKAYVAFSLDMTS